MRVLKSDQKNRGQQLTYEIMSGKTFPYYTSLVHTTVYFLLLTHAISKDIPQCTVNTRYK